MNKKKPQKRIHWHHLLARMFNDLLNPLGVEVTFDFNLMAKTPQGDILLIRRETPEWTEEQLERLPDGIRDTNAEQILLEFKYTESVNAKAFEQAISYVYFYRSSNKKLKEEQIKTFILSSKTPSNATKTEFGYSQLIKNGVYKSNNPLLKNITLICINDLDDEPHNYFIKCFASKQNERNKALDNLKKWSKFKLNWISQELLYYLGGIVSIFFFFF